MEKNEYWICPECGSEVDMNKNGCWRCRFVTDDVSKYKYNRKAEFVSNLKIMSIVIASLIAFIALSIFLIICVDNYYIEKQTRIVMEQKAREQQIKEFEQHLSNMQIREEERREEERREYDKQRFQSKQNNALQKINNLENQYHNCLAQYGNANGAYEQIHIQKEMERILEGINNIAAKENLPYKIIKNVQARARMDIAKRYGH